MPSFSVRSFFQLSSKGWGRAILNSSVTLKPMTKKHRLFPILGSLLTLVSLSCATSGGENANTSSDLVSGDCGPSTSTPVPAPIADDGASFVPQTSSNTVRVMTFNIKHGEIGGLEGLAETINKESPSLVALQEVDVDATRSGNVDQPHRLGQLTGMTNLFRTALTLSAGGSYGVALLSRFPILSSEVVKLTSSTEQRITAFITIQLPGKQVEVAVSHLDLDDPIKKTQGQEILAKFKDPATAILMGDMNAEPDESPIPEFSAVFRDSWKEAGQGDGFTIPVAKPNRRIDYIFVGKNWGAISEPHIPASTASDHLPYVITVELPK